jgi:quercetin dioxygenase-like cupin family protein
MSTVTTSAGPSLVGSGEGDAYWFLGALATIKASTESTGGGVAVIEHLAPRGHGSPLHVHTREDEWFYVLEGELTFWVDGEVSVAPAGSFVYGPRGLPHTFIVSSEVARFLLVTEPAGFERFTRALGQPAERREIPPPATATDPPDVDGLAKLAATFGLQIVGPPGIPA